MRTPSLLALLSVAACGADGDPDLREVRAIPAAMAPDVAAVALANNQFALDAFAVLPVDAPNQFFSPFSISSALWMVDAGARGATDAELRDVLHATLPGDRAHFAYGAMLDSIDAGRTHDLYTLATANRLFGQTGYPFKQPFLDLTGDAYGAPLEPVDFAQTEAARARINMWVSEQTDAMIPELLAPGVLSSDSRLALVNAILFKGKWVNQFDVANTRKAPFTVGGEAAVDVDMMTKEDAIAVAQLDGGRLGILPFRGNDLSMVVLLPDDAAGLPRLEAALTAASLDTAIAQAEATKSKEPIPVELPKFAFETEIDLVEPLQDLGIETAFDGRADLSGIADTGLFVSKAIHKAVITVDEAGAEAAAATAVVLNDSAPQPFAVDRPFAFFIYDHVTHSILFLGRVTDPR